MVGRELPNLRPNGEDHRGADGGQQMEMPRRMIFGVELPGCTNWSRKKTRIRKALAFLQDGTSDSRVTRFNSQVQI